MRFEAYRAGFTFPSYFVYTAQITNGRRLTCRDVFTGRPRKLEILTLAFRERSEPDNAIVTRPGPDDVPIEKAIGPGFENLNRVLGLS